MPFEHALRTSDDLRSMYRQPSKAAVAKQIGHIDGHCRDFIARSPFVLLASGDATGRIDVSPRGGRAGFVRVIDDHRLAIPDLAGNNRLDSLLNLVGNPRIGLLFCIPGFDETLRVNGAATITVDPEVLALCADTDLRPRVAIGVDVDEAFIHCAKALRRAALWHPDRWPDLAGMPTAACMLHDHYDLPELDLAAVEARLEKSYTETTWMVGGEDSEARS